MSDDAGILSKNGTTQPTGHTRGPWVAEFGEMAGYDCMTDAWQISGTVGGGWPAPIAVVDLCYYGQNARNHDTLPQMSKDYAEANARLIAAAPDLLAACKLALGAFERNDAIDWNELAGAIAKAEGR